MAGDDLERFFAALAGDAGTPALGTAEAEAVLHPESATADG